jgi:hypothetical protein
MTDDKYDGLQNKYEREWQNDDIAGIHVHRYSLWSCAGCTVPTIEWQVGVEPRVEDTDCADNFEPMSDSSYFPSRLKGSIQPKLFRSLKPEMAQLYNELVICFNNDLLVLCTMGLRSLLEAICNEKGVAGVNLEQRLSGLIKFLPSLNIIEALHAMRLTGNFAAHRLEALSRSDAAAAIEVVEDLLNFFYDLDYKASKVKNPARPSTKSGGVGPIQ